MIRHPSLERTGGGAMMEMGIVVTILMVVMMIAMMGGAGWALVRRLGRREPRRGGESERPHE
jgi:Flp pilus assembly protein TadG